MNDVIISVDKNAMAYKKNSFQKLGNKQQNLQNKLKFEFEDEIVEGQAWLEFEIDGVKKFTPMEQYEKGYQVDIKDSLLISDKVSVDLKITQNEEPEGVPVFITNIVTFDVEKTICAEEEKPDDYPSWFETANKIINEANNLNLDINKNDKVSTITINKKDGTQKSAEIYDGLSATIQVGNVTTLEPGENATVTNVGTENNAIFNFGIPKGEPGQDGSGGGGGITTESDPTVPSYVKNITEENINSWNTVGNKVDKVSGKELSSNDYTTTEKEKLAGLNNYTLPQASSTTLGGVKIGTTLEMSEDGILNTKNTVFSEAINKIVVVDELPETEEEGVLYLVKETIETLINLYPSQVESTSTNGFTITFIDKNVTVTGSNTSTSVWGETEQFVMNLEPNKTYYLQFTHESGTMDDSDRITSSDGIVTSIILIGYGSSGSTTNLINEVERDASGIYEKYTFTPTEEFVSYKLRLQTKKYITCSDWKLSIVIAEESE